MSEFHMKRGEIPTGKLFHLAGPTLNPERHFFLYAKKWYKHDNVMEDMKKLQSDYTGLDVKHLTNDLIIGKMIELAYDSLRGRHNITKFIHRIAQVDAILGVARKERILQACLSVLCITPREIFGELGEPDPTVLPLSKDE